MTSGMMIGRGGGRDQFGSSRCFGRNTWRLHDVSKVFDMARPATLAIMPRVMSKAGQRTG
jgi:hypothetical protein